MLVGTPSVLRADRTLKPSKELGGVTIRTNAEY